jgi:hypothetical protein
MQKGGGEAVVVTHGYYNLRTVSGHIQAFMEGYKAAQDAILDQTTFSN